MTMTKEQYIVLRKSGKKRNDVQKEHFGNDSITFKTFLSITGLLSLETELIAMRDFQPGKASEPLPIEPTKQEVEKVEYPPLTKELVESELAKGKSVSQIERENGMKLNTLPWKMKGWGIVNPNAKKKAVQEKAETVTEAVEERIECDYEVVDEEVIEKSEEAHVETDRMAALAVKIAEVPQTQFIYFQIPIIKGYEIVDRGFGDIFGALQLAATRNIDLVRSAEELFMVMQRYTQLLHSQMETLIVEGDPAEHVQKFIQKHNTIHINKQTATE